MQKKDEELSGNETSEEETTEEIEEEVEVETTDSEYGRHDAQPLVKPTKKLKTTIRKKVPLKKDESIRNDKHGNDKHDKRKRKLVETEENKEKDLNKEKDSPKKAGSSKSDAKEYKKFRSDDCDSDYSNDVLDKVTHHKVCIYPGFNISCHKFEANKVKNYLGNDFPAITFEKKCKDDKCYEFTVPLNSGYSIVKAIFKFAQLNPEIFAGMNPPTFNNSKR